MAVHVEEDEVEVDDDDDEVDDADDDDASSLEDAAFEMHDESLLRHSHEVDVWHSPCFVMAVHVTLSSSSPSSVVDVVPQSSSSSSATSDVSSHDDVSCHSQPSRSHEPLHVSSAHDSSVMKRESAVALELLILQLPLVARHSHRSAVWQSDSPNAGQSDVERQSSSVVHLHESDDHAHWRDVVIAVQRVVLASTLGS